MKAARCGGGGDTVAEEKKILNNPVIAVKTVDIEAHAL